MSRDREQRGGRSSSREETRGGRDRDERPSRDREDRGGRSSSRGSSGFSYQRRDPDETKRRAQQGGGDDFDVYLDRKVKMFKPADGDNTVRILPPTWKDPKHYGLDIWVHYGVGPDRQTYLCLHKMKGEPCPICEERAQAARSGDEDYAKDLEPRRRVLVYLVDRDNEKEGLQAYPMPQGLDQDITKVSVDKKSGEVLAIDHPDEGYDVSFEKSGSQKKTRYEGAQIARRESELGNPDWLDQAVDLPLPEVLVYYEYDHIKAEFGGGAGPQKSSRDRESSRDRDERPSRDRDEPKGRDRDERPSRDSGRNTKSEPDLTWESIHAMTGQELDDLVELEKLDINPNDAKDDEDLADWICDEMKIVKQEARRTRVSVDTKEESHGADKLREMRQRRQRD